MTLALAFWVIALIVLVFGLWTWRGSPEPWHPIAWGWVLFVMILILGWAKFGAPIHG